jgi:hypothetical protein
MKKISLILFFILVKNIVFAQKDSCYAGVYLTKDDLINNNLSHKINTSEKGNKLMFPMIADWKLEVKIITPCNTYKFPQGSIYGYHECGRNYRYSPGGRLYAIEDFYRIEERGNLIIYTSLFNGGDEYYYSTDLDAPIRRLNMPNLKSDFYGHPNFIRAVKKIKRNGVKGGLAMQDNKGNFIINDIYEQTINKKQPLYILSPYE